MTVFYNRAVAAVWIGLGRFDVTFGASECCRSGRESADEQDENNNERDGGPGGAAMAMAVTVSADLVHGRVDARGCLCHRQGSAIVSVERRSDATTQTNPGIQEAILPRLQLNCLETSSALELNQLCSQYLKTNTHQSLSPTFGCLPDLYYGLQITCAREALNAVHRKIRMKIVVIFSYLFLSFRREMYRLARSFAPEPN